MFSDIDRWALEDLRNISIPYVPYNMAHIIWPILYDSYDLANDF